MNDRQHDVPTLPADEPSPRPPSRRIPLWLARGIAALVITAAVGIVYRGALRAPFIYDDVSTVIGNASIVRFWPLFGEPGGHGPLSAPKDNALHGRPLVNLSMAVNYHYGRLDPRGYHAVDIVLHALSALWLWAIVGRVLRLDFFQRRFERAADPLAFAVALVWALHPLQTESVVYVTQRTELTMGFFYLATFYGSLRYWDAQSALGRISWLVLSMLACAAGMVSKEVMASAPVMMLLFERTFIAGSFRRALRCSRPLYAALALTWLPLVALNYHGPRTPAAGFHLGVSSVEWWLTQSKVLWLYLKLAIWPWPLVIHYEIPYFHSLREAWPWVLATMLLGLTAFALFWRHWAAGFAAIWVLVVLSPTLVVPLVAEVAAERRMYLPLAGIAMLAVVGGFVLTRRFVPRPAHNVPIMLADRRALAITAACALIVATTFGLLSAGRVALYRDELSLWQDAERHQPDSSVVHVNEGVLLQKVNRPREAMEHFQKAVKLNPESAEANYNLARALEAASQPRDAIEHYQQALRLNPQMVAAHINLGLLLGTLGKTQQAIEQYELALRLQPNSFQAHGNLGVLMISTGRTEQAIQHFEQALRIKPVVEAYINLAAAYAQAGRPADSVAAAEAALRLAHSQRQTAMATQIEGWLKAYRDRVTRPASSPTKE